VNPSGVKPLPRPSWESPGLRATAMEECPSLPKPAPVVRVAVVGCGAISQSFHLPVLAGHEAVRLTALVDRDLARATELARAYGVETVLADANALSPDRVDAALVATPPFHHPSCCTELARRGIHVLVEKPMAIQARDARAMADAAREAGVVLTVGYFRRLFPNVGLLRAALEQGTLGRPLGFDAEEGDEYTWHLATLSNLRKEQGGGGVLIDLGSHVLDLLLYLFPGAFEVLDYRDNALGGSETDCLLRLRLEWQGSPVDGRVELSRTRRLRGTLRVVCERGTLELRTGERYRVGVLPNDTALVDPVRGTPRDFALQATWADERETPGYEGYRAEIDDWLQAIRTGEPAQLSADSGVRTVELIEECYDRAGRLNEPWVWEGLTPPAVRKAAPPRRVLVTGATGFIGGRVAERLQLGEGWQVRALVHNPSRAARLARLPVEMVQGDLKSPADMARAVEGCDAVVHCAIGTAYGRRREIFAVTVGGTQALADAARAAGVKRFVHLSSIAVHGNDVAAVIDEATPVRPPKGDDYSESKAAAEEVIRRAARAGLPALMLRPGNVYGPFSKTFVVRPMQYLARNALVLAGSADTPSNTVYVDNLVRAVVCGLEAPEGVADGRAFTISDGDDWTWGEFYGYLAAGLGRELRTAPLEPAPNGRAAWSPFGWLRSWTRGTADLLTSPEFRALGKRFLARHPLGALPRRLLDGSPRFDRAVRRLLKTDAVLIYRRPSPAAEDVLKIRPRPGRIRIDAARKVLGYTPPVARDRAMELTLEWVRYARLA
jgi:predicted dehydrogenase/nucleoside-diphosphate-sugar epimerase